jgi:PAS domain S-box-containing protein
MLLIAVGLVLRLMRSLQLSRSEHELALQGAHDGFWTWNPRTKKLVVGQRLLSILGYEQNFLQDTHAWLELVHPDDRDDYNHTVANHLKGLTPYFYCEYRVRVKSGKHC